MSASTETPWTRRLAAPAKCGGCPRRLAAAYHWVPYHTGANRPSQGRWRGRRLSDLSIHAAVAAPVPVDADILGALAPEERRRISTRLGAGLAGIGLLVLGTLLMRLSPDQWQIGELCRALACGGRRSSNARFRRSRGGYGRYTPGYGPTRRHCILASAATGDFVTATLIPLNFLEGGRIFEERSSLGARAAIDGIRALAAHQAVRWRNGVEEKVNPNVLSPGDGNSCSSRRKRSRVDGTVMEGRAAVDQSAITGESVYEDVGSRGVPCSRERWRSTGCLKIQVRGAGADTVLWAGGPTAGGRRARLGPGAATV